MIDAIKSSDGLFQITVQDIEQIDDRVYSLIRETGEVTFGDGISGARPPSGRSHVFAAYSYGAGKIFNEFDLMETNYPLLIPVADLVDPEAKDTNINFVLVGVVAIKFELTADMLNIVATDITTVPLPPSLGLMALALAVFAMAAGKNRNSKND